MAKKPLPEIDDELFDEVYGKAYTGPLMSAANNAQEKTNSNKRPLASANANGESDEEDEPSDPNAVPTDFTSREAKVWVAKAKATERNWKKRKEEEMICKICGESGHFTQGCPATLGANRKSTEPFQRVPARDKHIRALFTEKVIRRIEKDAGCKIRMEEKFIIVSGKDSSSLTKGVDAVHKVIQDEDKAKGSSSSQRTRSRSPDVSPVGSQLRRSESQRSYPSPRRHSESQRSHPSPRNMSQIKSKAVKQEKFVEDEMRADLQQLSRRSPQAYGNDGARSRPSHSKSPPHHTFTSDAFSSFNIHAQNIGVHKTHNWDTERHGSDIHSSSKFEFPAYPKTLEELEMEFKREAMEFGRIRDKEEDEENYKHREAIRELRETYMKKVAMLRGMHAKQWEEFLQADIQRMQRAPRQPMTASSYNYNHPSYSDYDQSSGNPHYAGTNLAMDSRSRYPFPTENYSASKPNDAYGEFQQRHEDFGKAYNR
ncbi:uncharacterized protein LOC143852530 [Tasmannia lanceolata]|uniref:uncharacterized protein LOC143852530 n=1 Tax=Tasmannia lanceolata TaxID=3420 RepID=UPI004063CF38